MENKTRDTNTRMERMDCGMKTKGKHNWDGRRDSGKPQSAAAAMTE
jgi:hypothetical protein